jgi:hypothetical protein
MNGLKLKTFDNFILYYAVIILNIRVLLRFSCEGELLRDTFLHEKSTNKFGNVLLTIVTAIVKIL